MSNITFHNLSPFLGMSLVLLFTFSTIYTLGYYYNEGLGVGFDNSGLDETEDSGLTFDTLIGAISWLSPFGILKGLISYIMQDIPVFYDVLDKLVLRPSGWFAFFVFWNYVISLIPTVGKGE